MTCIVGVLGRDGADQGRVLLGGDRAGVVRGKEIYTLRNAKVFRKGPYAIGFTTSFRLGQIVRYGADLPAPPALLDENDTALEEFLATAFVMALRQAFDHHGLDPSLGETGSLVVGVRGRLFVIGKNYQVLAGCSPYVAVGSGRHLAYGALAALEGYQPPDLRLEERAQIALEAASRFSPDVQGPFDFVEL